MITEHEKSWTDALKADLAKPFFESSFTEVVLSLTELRATLKDLAGWMAPQKTATPLALLPGNNNTLKHTQHTHTAHACAAAHAAPYTGGLLTCTCAAPPALPTAQRRRM